MHHALISLLIAFALFVGMLLLLEIGRRIGAGRRARDPGGAGAGTGAVEGAVFALLGLLVAFTFSGAASRFDARRALIVEEANAIGTAYLRLDVVPANAQPGLRDLFRRYADSRLEVYRQLTASDLEAARAELDRSIRLQGEIWNQAVIAGQLQGAPPAVAMLLLPALNQMFDVSTTRTMALRMHPPAVIFVMLFGLALASALLAGYAMGGAKTREWLHMFAFAAVLAITVYVIFDLEYPRLGLIRIGAFDQVLVDVRESMN
jgi:hypothetical protein